MNGVKCSNTNHTSVKGTARDFIALGLKYLVGIFLVTYSCVVEECNRKHLKIVKSTRMNGGQDRASECVLKRGKCVN